MRGPAPTPSTGTGEADAHERGAGLAAIVLATTAFSWGFIIVKVLPLDPAPLASWRLAIGTGVLSAVALALRTPWPRLRSAAFVAGVAFGLHQLLFIAATKATSVAIVTLVAAMQPLVVSLVSRRTVGEPVPPALVGCALIALAGVGLVVRANLADPSRSLYGDLLAVANLLAFTGYFLAAKRSRQQGTPTLTLTATFLGVALLVVLPVGLLGGGGFAVGGVEVGLLAVLALVPGNGHLLLNWAHRRVTAALSSLALAAVPLLASIWAHLVLGEPYGWRHVVGMLLVAGAIEGGRRVERRTSAAATVARPPR